MEKIVLELPDALAAEARAQGLLTPEALRTWLEDTLQKRRVEDFFSAADRLADQATLTRTEVEQEVTKARQERSCA